MQSPSGSRDRRAASSPTGGFARLREGAGRVRVRWRRVAVASPVPREIPGGGGENCEPNDPPGELRSRREKHGLAPWDRRYSFTDGHQRPRRAERRGSSVIVVPIWRDARVATSSIDRFYGDCRASSVKNRRRSGFSGKARRDDDGVSDGTGSRRRCVGC